MANPTAHKDVRPTAIENAETDHQGREALDDQGEGAARPRCTWIEFQWRCCAGCRC